MTDQELFDKACKGIVDQGGPSIDTRGCVYRSNNGRKCAAGHLIPDEEYSPAWEGNGVALLPKKFWTNEQEPLVSALQRAHDMAATSAQEFMSDFKQRARRVAELLNLNPAVLG